MAKGKVVLNPLVYKKFPKRGRQVPYKVENAQKRKGLLYCESKSSGSSPPEERIELVLRSNKIPFYREVRFNKCVSSKTGWLYRFDFYLPLHNILIEYDGSGHKDKDWYSFHDEEKTKFAKDFDFVLLRYNTLHWEDLEKIIEDTLQISK